MSFMGKLDVIGEDPAFADSAEGVSILTYSASAISLGVGTSFS